MSTAAPDRSIGPENMLGVVTDAANVISLAGLAAGLMGIYLAATGRVLGAVIGLLWAVLFDWLDGPVARRTPGRSPELSAFGAAIDSQIDIVSLGVLPALIILAVGDFEAAYVPVAFVFLAVGVVRLSYFNIHGLVGSYYRGLPYDHDALLLALLFVAQPSIGSGAFRVLICVAMLVCAALNVSPIRVRKLAGPWCAVVAGYVIVLTIVFGLRITSA
jgi:phosphatidylserine synthase